MAEKLMLPASFLEEIQELLEDTNEYQAFLNSYQRERAYGLRYNPLKTERAIFEAEIPFSLTRIPWARDGYFGNREEQPGKSPFHEAGAYYIQEPSAMAVADLLEAKPGEVICDLCGAPGGKSTQIAGAMNQEGLLVSNEIMPARAKILSQNMERMGVRNAVVINEPPERMAALFPVFFDKILVDAPCSGEGMFRKNPEAVREWSREQVKICSERQLFILNQAKEMLKPGGVLVYSTCTFNKEEDESVIAAFLAENPDFSIVPLVAENGISEGKLAGTIRLWPHLLQGEGHFAAKLCKKEGPFANGTRMALPEKRREIVGLFQEFCDMYLNVKLEGNVVAFKDELYLLPKQMRTLNGIKIARAGLHLGTNKKNRFEPSHALALSLKKEDVKQWVEVKEAERFIKGESFQTIPSDGSESYKGWCLVTMGSFSLGWGKISNGMVKNHYPKGLRIG